MTKVTDKMREAAYKEMENFWGDDIDFEEGGKFDGFIVDMFNAMTAAQDGVKEPTDEKALEALYQITQGGSRPDMPQNEAFVEGYYSGFYEAQAQQPNTVQVDREDLALVLGNYTFGDHHESNWACNRLLRFLSTEDKG